MSQPTLAFRFSGAAFALALSACGGGGSAGKSAGPPDASVLDDASLPTDASLDTNVDATPVQCALGAGATITDAASNASLVFQLAVALDASAFGSSFQGTFYASAPTSNPGGLACCQAFGACNVCSSPCDAGRAPAPPTENAGTVTLQGPRFTPLSLAYLPNAGTVTLADGGTAPAPDGGDYYATSEDSGPGTYGLTINGGDTVCVSANGEEAPPFANLPLVIPSLPAITGPVIPASGVFPISSTNDFVLTWVPTPDQIAVVYVIGPDLSSVVSCELDAAAGTVSIPQAALASLHGEQVVFEWDAVRFVSYGVGTQVLAVGANTFFATNTQVE